MPRPPRLLAAGAVYHVTSRGNNKADLFGDEADRRAWLGLMAEARQRFSCKYHAYCLMTNHIHLILETSAPNLDAAMEWIKRSYSKHFDSKYGFTGHLYDGRYKSKIILDDRYFMTAIRYVHQNPIAARMFTDVADHPWSSHHDYLGLGEGLSDPGQMLGMLSGDLERARHAYLDFMRQPIPADELKKLDSYRNGSLGGNPRSRRRPLRKLVAR